MSKFLRIFAMRTQNFFWWNKSNFVFQKKKDFDEKPKMTKISGFENFEIVKMGKKGSFGENLCGVKNACKFCYGVSFLFSFLYVLIIF